MRRTLRASFSRLMSTHSLPQVPPPRPCPHKVLIANRGEIAIRVARTLQLFQIPSVAVHAADDADSLHVLRCDARHALAGSGAAAYLDPNELLRAAQAHGCTAVHPGYGMLSESPVFAAAVEAAGLVWIGPNPRVLSQFADKIAASARARSLGLRVPASSGAPPPSLPTLPPFYSEMLLSLTHNYQRRCHQIFPPLSPSPCSTHSAPPPSAPTQSCSRLSTAAAAGACASFATESR
jgi:hypothetical protein